MDDTYPMPKHGWTCFHCGETFKTPGKAREHFGRTPLDNKRMRLALEAIEMVVSREKPPGKVWVILRTKIKAALKGCR